MWVFVLPVLYTNAIKLSEEEKQVGERTHKKDLATSTKNFLISFFFFMGCLSLSPVHFIDEN